MATTVLFCPWPISSFDSGVEGVNPITPTGTAVDNSLVSAVQAAGVANNVPITTGGAGGISMPLLESVWVGTTQPLGNNAMWLDTTTPSAAQWKYWNGSAWVVVPGSGGGGSGDMIAADNLSQVADVGSSRSNLHISDYAALAVSFSNLSLTGTATVDGVSIGNGKSVLCLGQTDPTQNGLQARPPTGTGAWARPTDFAHGLVINETRKCKISQGTLYANTDWALQTYPVTVDTTAQTWVTPQVPTQSLIDSSGNPASTSFVQQFVAQAIAGLSEPLRFSSPGVPTAALPFRGFTETYAGNITVGNCQLQVLPTQAPSGTNLVCTLQKSTDGGGTWSTVETLTIVAGSSTAVSANPAASITGPVELALDITANGGQVPFEFIAAVAGG